MSLQIYTETQIPKYHNGKWLWNTIDNKFIFQPSDYEYTPINAIQMPINQFGILQFNDNWTQKDEIIFRKKFQRTAMSKDSDVITIQDIKNVVLFSASNEKNVSKIVDFFYTTVVDEFLNALIIYFEYFLRTVKFLLKRRIESKGDRGRICDMNSVRAEQIVSTNLAQYRLLLAREYAKVSNIHK